MQRLVAAFLRPLVRESLIRAASAASAAIASHGGAEVTARS